MSWNKKKVAEVKKDTIQGINNIVTHAWNADHTQLAISPNSNKIMIYETKGSFDMPTWELVHTLAEHDGHISAIDWCKETNVIVSCAHDRNAYVWNFVEGVWKPTLVILRIQRAATSVKWSPAGNKFAVSSAAKCVPVCHYEEQHNFWVSKIIRKHKSTVLSVDWCCNNKFIVTGSTDMKCRVFSAYIEGLDDEADDGFGEIWAKQHVFGDCLAEFNQVRAWINNVAWSPCGFRIAFSGQGSTLGFVQILAGAKPIVTTVDTPHLPFLALDFLSKDSVVAVGFDQNPTIYVADGDETSPEWGEAKRVDEQKAVAKKAAPKKNAAFAMFQNMDSRGQSSGAKPKENAPSTRHKAQVSSLQIVSKTRFTTAGMDGRVLDWDLQKLGFDLAALKLQ
jgi:actin related protein 2/3 complex subunit 1A/1B